MLLDARGDKDPWLQLDFDKMSVDELEMRLAVLRGAEGKFDYSGKAIHLKGMSHELLYFLYQKHNLTLDDDMDTQVFRLQLISKEAAETKQIDGTV